MTTSDEQLAAVYAEFGEPHDGWTDPLSLEALLRAAHDHDVLRDVRVFQLLNDDRDTFLVSVEVCANVYAHSAPIPWHEVRPESDAGGAEAVRHVLGRLGEVAAGVRANFLLEVAEVVSTAVFDRPFATMTPGGKAVCCEFTTTTAEPAKRYAHRVARGSEAVRDYAFQWTPAGTLPLGSLAAVDAVTADLITDLLHWLAANGRDPDTVLLHAQTHFEAELEPQSRTSHGAVGDPRETSMP